MKRSFCQLFKVQQSYRTSKRLLQSGFHATCLEKLETKCIIQVSGQDSLNYLQGLVTNDMSRLVDSINSMYSLFLNIKGRILYDVIIYKAKGEDKFYLECDKAVTGALEKHLKLYRIKKKVNIKVLEDQLKVWTLFDPKVNESSKVEASSIDKACLNGSSDSINFYKDPRLPELGLRIISEPTVSRDELLQRFECKEDIDCTYKEFRCRLGVAEGSEELVPGKALPLEANGDYLNGISFHKGCYIGQELTARTHHTGVVRKRLMPIVFEEQPSQTFDYDEKIVNQAGNVVGSFKTVEKKCGLALIRIAEAFNSKSLNIKGNTLIVTKPFWWPSEKDSSTAQISDKSK